MTRRSLLQSMGVVFLAAASASALPYVGCDSFEKFREEWRAFEPHRKALESKDVAALDRLFSAVLARYARGEISDVDVASDFGMFARQDAAREPLHASWVAAYPKSEAAHYAQAVYLIARGWAGRGTEFAGKTDDTQFAAMSQAFDKSWKALDAAEALSKRPTLEWGDRIGILKTSGRRGAQLADEIYRKAMRSDPKAVQLRIEYIEASTPRWGGSFERLAQLAADAKSLGAADRRYVEYWAIFHAGRDHELFEHDDVAIELYKRAMPLCPGLGEATNGAMRIYRRKQDWPALVEAASRYVGVRPGDGWGWTMRAYAYSQVKDLDNSFKDYVHATQLGYPQAFEALGWFYATGSGGAKRDYAKAIDLYMIAHEKGIAGAKDEADKIRAGTGLK